MVVVQEEGRRVGETYQRQDWLDWHGVEAAVLFHPIASTPLDYFTHLRFLEYPLEIPYL